MTSDQARASRLDVFYGLGAYLIWGMLPVYMRLMQAVPPIQIIAHRALWTAALTGALVLALRRGRGLVAALRQGRVAVLLLASALLIGANWLIYAWAVLNGHTLDASLGYFINPLVNVALGVLVLKERLHRLEKVAVGIAAIGVGALALQGGTALVVPLALALTFGVYGLIRKVAAIDPLEGLAVETMLLAPLAAGVLVWADRSGTAMFGRDTGTDLLLLSSCLITAAPLLLFAAAARRMRYSALGVLQYIAPTMQFLQAVLLFGEKLTAVHMFTFACIWAALALYAVSALRSGSAAPVCPPE